MGKGNRNRNDRYDSVYSMSGASGAATKPAKQTGKKDNTTVLLIAVIAVLIVAALAIYLFGSSGIVERGTVYVSSDNYEVTGTMIPYFENMAYNSTFEQYYMLYYNYYYSGDATQAYNAAAQAMAQYTLDSFFDSAINTSKEVVALCEAAKAAGVQLDDEDLKELSEGMKEIGSTSGFGNGVKKSDIKKAMELYALALKYSEMIGKDIEASITEDIINSYVEENKSNYYTADYLKYKLSLIAEDYEGDELGYAVAEKRLDEYLTKLSEAKTAEEFKKLVIAYEIESNFASLIEKNKGDLDTPEASISDAAMALIIENVTDVVLNGAAKKDSFTDNETYKTLFKTIAEGYINTCKTAVDNLESSASYTTSTEDKVLEWLSSADTKVGATMTTDDKTEAEYAKTAYMMVEEMHLDKSETKDFAHILILADRENDSAEKLAEAKAKAEKVLAEYKAGEMTLEAFEKLAEEYTEDSGCVYENTKRSDMVEEIDAWIFASTRKEGDLEIIETEFGYHVTYFIGNGLAPYYANAVGDYTDDKHADEIDAFEEKYVTLNEKAIAKRGGTAETEAAA